jgi:hypothetical protein
MVWKRLRGRKLQQRWTKTTTLPPVEEHPPQRGMPAIETNHGFTCKFHPCGSLGPSCNHDLNPLLRLPVLHDALRAKLQLSLEQCSFLSCSLDLADEDLKHFKEACAEMFASVIEHEYYCGAYASKEQPKLKALLKNMASSLKRMESNIATAKSQGVSFSNFDLAAKILHNLVSSVNRSTHKGYPEIVSYLTKQPSHYCSHAFTNLYMFNQQNAAHALMEALLLKAQGKEVLHQPHEAQISSRLRKQHQLNDVDFIWRPAILEVVPWYFFAAMTHAAPANVPSLPWYVHQKKMGLGTHTLHFKLHIVVISTILL